MVVHALHEGADLVGRLGRGAVDAPQHAEVRPDAEVLFVVRGEHYNSHSGVLAHLVESRSKLQHQVLGDRVEAVAMHDDAGDGPLAADVNQLTHQAVNNGMPPATSMTAPVI